MSSTFYGRVKPEGFENMGTAWKDPEIKQLLSEIKEKKPLQDIAKLHKRTPGGVRSRLREIAASYFINESKQIPEIMILTGLPKDDIIDAINKREYRDEIKSKTKVNKVNEASVPAPTPVKKSETSELQEILVALKAIEKRVNEYIKEKSIFDE